MQTDTSFSTRAVCRWEADLFESSVRWLHCQLFDHSFATTVINARFGTDEASCHANFRINNARYFVGWKFFWRLCWNNKRNKQLPYTNTCHYVTIEKKQKAVKKELTISNFQYNNVPSQWSIHHIYGNFDPLKAILKQVNKRVMLARHSYN